MAPHSQGRRLQGTEEREGRGKNTKVLSPRKVHKWPTQGIITWHDLGCVLCLRRQFKNDDHKGPEKTNTRLITMTLTASIVIKRYKNNGTETMKKMMIRLTAVIKRKFQVQLWVRWQKLAHLHQGNTVMMKENLDLGLGFNNNMVNRSSWLNSEVRFVHAVTAGGSVKFLPAV